MAVTSFLPVLSSNCFLRFLLTAGSYAAPSSNHSFFFFFNRSSVRLQIFILRCGHTRPLTCRNMNFNQPVQGETLVYLSCVSFHAVNSAKTVSHWCQKYKSSFKFHLCKRSAHAALCDITKGNLLHFQLMAWPFKLKLIVLSGGVNR